MTDKDTSPEAVERLAQYHDWRDDGESQTADIIRALSAALEAEKAESVRFQKGWSLVVDQCDKEYARAEAAEAERDALKAELAEAVDALENITIAIGMGWDLDGVVDDARAFLARHQKEADQ